MAKENTPNKSATAKRHNDGVRKKLAHASGLMSKLIQVKVPGREDPFQVHKYIICSASPFFRKACSGPWKEKEGWIDMPEDDPETFETYVQWLYLDAVRIEFPETGSVFTPFNNLRKCFILGDKLLDVRFKNAIIDALIKLVKVRGRYSSTQAKQVYKCLPESSAFRRLYVDFWAWKSTDSWYANGNWKNAPMEFFKDLAKRQQEV